MHEINSISRDPRMLISYKLKCKLSAMEQNDIKICTVHTVHDYKDQIVVRKFWSTHRSDSNN